MRVLVITSMFPTPANPFYGIFVKEQVESLRQKGVEIEVLFIEGYKNKWNYFKSIRSLYRKILTGKYDLIHSHYGLNGWVGRMQFIVPLVVSFHGDDILGTPAGIADGWLRMADLQKPRYTFISRILAGSNKILARMSDAVVVQSKQMCRESGCPQARIIPCGVDFQTFRSIDRVTACRQSGLDPGRKYVLFPADPTTPVKNFPLAKEVFDIAKQQIPGLELMTFARKKSRPDVVLQMNAADLMIFTSLHEGAGLVVKEAMACNLPVVSVDVGDVRDVISGATNCYVTSRNPQEMADKVLDILEKGERSNGRQRIERFEMGNIAEKITEVYKSAIRY